MLEYVATFEDRLRFGTVPSSMLTLPMSETTQALNASLSPSPYLPRPLVIVIGMPKSGTGTIADFFTCNRWKTSHWRCGRSGEFCGDCMTRWVTDVSGQPAGDKSAELRSACGDYDVFAQVDYNPGYTCLFPQVFFLQTLLRYLPGACFVLNTRPTDHWLSSVRSWAIGTELGGLLGRMIDACPIHPRNETGLGEWYDRYKMRASLAMRSAKCALEFNIEDDVGVTSHLNRFFKLNSSTQCLGVYAHKTG